MMRQGDMRLREAPFGYYDDRDLVFLFQAPDADALIFTAITTSMAWDRLYQDGWILDDVPEGRN